MNEFTNGDPLAPAGWSYPSNFISIADGVMTGNTTFSSRHAINTGFVPEPGSRHQTTLVVNSVTGDRGVAVQIGGTLGTWRNEPGTYEEEIVAETNAPGKVFFDKGTSAEIGSVSSDPA